MPVINDRARSDPGDADPSAPSGLASSHPGADIRALATAAVALRSRPGLHVGGDGPEATHLMALELVDNAIRGSLRGRGDEVRATLHRDGSLSVGDEGRGLPVGPSASDPSRDTLEIALTTAWA